MQKSWSKSLGVSGVVLVAFWLVTFGLIQAGYRWFGGWPATEIAQLFGSIGAIVLALRLGGHLASYFLGAMIAFTIAELVVHFRYGLRSVQGAPTHFAVLAAAALGVLLGGLLTLYLRSRVDGAREVPSISSDEARAA